MITNNSGVVMQVLGLDAVFECTAVSEPVHISRWLFGNVELTNSEKYFIQVWQLVDTKNIALLSWKSIYTLSWKSIINL